MSTATGLASSQIPLVKPYIAGNELRYISQATASRAIGSDGFFTSACARLIGERFGVHKVFMVPSCTSALEMASELLGLGPGDEVILPSYTFVSTANAFARLGARPVFVDIRPDTLTIDENLIEGAITPKTRAIFPVHYAGVACNMDAIMSVASRYDLRVVEDAAQGVNAYYRGRALGSIGHLGTYSFHSTKNLVCGEGGALCCNDPSLIKRAEIIRDKGTNRAQFFRGEVDKYTWVDIGSSSIPSELACAFLYAQLESMDAIKLRRRTVYQYYLERFLPLADAGRLQVPHIPADCEPHFSSFYLLLNSARERDSLMGYLRKNGVGATFHFVPLHTSPVGLRYGYRPSDLPVTEELSARILRLPAFVEMTAMEQGRVIALVTSFLTARTSSIRRPTLALSTPS